MDVRNWFDFLVQSYGLSYREQEFPRSFGGNWIVSAYSFYNESGCFTICHLEPRNELSFYYASKISENLDDLMQTKIDVHKVEPKVWEKHQKLLGSIKNPFFECSTEKVLHALADVIKARIDADGEFFGVKV